MRWRLWIGAVAVGLLSGLAAYMFMPAAPGDLACRHVEVVDGQTGALVQGAEDIVLDPRGQRLIVSAYDRRADTAGGLYGLALDALLDPAVRRVTAQRLALPAAGEMVWPHGLALGAPEGNAVKLGVIVREGQRGAQKQGTIRAYMLEGDRLQPTGSPFAGPLLCNANGLAVDPAGGFFVTADRSACGAWGRMVEDVLGLANGRLLTVGRGGVRVLDKGIGFANGIALDDTHLYVAATRSGEIRVYDRDALIAGKVQPMRLALHGAPDNLAFGDDGVLYVAAHRSLLRFAAFRAGLRGDSASEIYRYDARAGTGARLKRLGIVNGSGAVAGATVALAVRGRLVLGAAFDGGVSVCAKGSRP